MHIRRTRIETEYVTDNDTEKKNVNDGEIHQTLMESVSSVFVADNNDSSDVSDKTNSANEGKYDLLQVEFGVVKNWWRFARAIFAHQEGD